MPDITMCTGGDCPMRSTCYRYTAKPSTWQAWFTEVPFMQAFVVLTNGNPDGTCAYLMPVRERTT